MAEKTTPTKPVKGPTNDTTPHTAIPPKVAAPVKSGATKAKPAKSTRDKVKKEAGKFGKQAAEKARGYARDGKTKASGALDEVAKLVDGAANDVDTRFGSEYGKYARSAAENVSGFADTLRAKEVDELMDDLREFVRKSPAIALGAAAAVGFVVARIVKAGIDGESQPANRD